MSDMIDAINWNGHCTLFNTIFQQQKVFYKVCKVAARLLADIAVATAVSSCILFYMCIH